MSWTQVEGLCVGYRGRRVLEDVSFALEPGGITALLGANGSGKTTLLKAMCGILPHQGVCTVAGQVLEGLSPRRLAQICGYIPQRSGIALDISLLDVVLMGFNPSLSLLQRPSRGMRRQAVDALERVGLAYRAQESYRRLSEGEKQRVILARTLVGKGSLLLLDEPESALDVHHRYQMLHLLRQWCAQGERGGLAALHDPQLALNTCHRVLVLDRGRVAAQLCPRRDSLAEMEGALEPIYGPIQLLRCASRWGSEELVMLKQREAAGWNL